MMQTTWNHFPEGDLICALENALESLPNLAVKNVRNNVRLRTESRPIGVDAIIQIEANGKPTTLLIEAKHSVFPRDAREIAWQLRRAQKSLRDSEGLESLLPVIASNSISDGAKVFLRSENIGYYEEGGSLFLIRPDLYILLERPQTKTAERTNRTLFSGRRSQVLHTILHQPESWFSVKALAEQAFVSPATVSQVLVELEKREWMSSRGSGPHKERRLQQPASLLDAWAKHATSLPKPRSKRFFVPSTKAEDLMNRIDRVCTARGSIYAITGEWAAQLYSPFLSSISQVRCRLPAGEVGLALASELNAREVHEGSNLAVLESRSSGDFLFREQERGVWLANPIIVYLDLLQSDGRAKEMADHLRRERIRF